MRNLFESEVIIILHQEVEKGTTHYKIVIVIGKKRTEGNLHPHLHNIKIPSSRKILDDIVMERTFRYRPT
jgi:hypothetical protein